MAENNNDQSKRELILELLWCALLPTVILWTGNIIDGDLVIQFADFNKTALFIMGMAFAMQNIRNVIYWCCFLTNIMIYFRRYHNNCQDFQDCRMLRDMAVLKLKYLFG